MLTFIQARKIAETWVDVVTGGGSMIDRKKTKTFPYGWLFCWNSKVFLADPSIEENALVGNVPILVDRVNGEVLVAGPPGINWIARYEASIPPARLAMTPEEPRWD